MIKNQKGQALVEYLILIALVAVASIAVLRVVSQNLQSRLANVAYALQGQPKSARYDQIEKSHTSKRDLSDFFKGAAKNE